MGTLINRQLHFFAKKKAGCLFAAVAARRPSKYGWHHQIIASHSDRIDEAVSAAIADANITTLSMLFPTVSTLSKFRIFLQTLKQCQFLFLEQEQEYEQSMCLGFRAKIGGLSSWVGGFGNFRFLPDTRRAPCVELTMRVKARPHYDFVFKEAPPNVIHLADLDMKGIPLDSMKVLWKNTFVETKRRLGKQPDMRSGAKTTYAIPIEFYKTMK